MIIQLIREHEWDPASCFTIALSINNDCHYFYETQNVFNCCCVIVQVEQFLLKSQAECRCAEKYCDRLKIYKISEGLYRIGDRNVFIRVWRFLLSVCPSVCYSFSCVQLLFILCPVVQGSSRHGASRRRMVGTTPEGVFLWPEWTVNIY